MSERWIKSVGKNVTLFAIGGFIYYMIEVVWRGYSALPMVLVGGLCFLLCGSINEFHGVGYADLETDACLCSWNHCDRISFGLLLNIIFGMGIWD